MSVQIAKEVVAEFTVSTIQTLAGGGGNNRPITAPFQESDYDTPWPYETLVYGDGSSKGLYHEAYSDERAAKDGHKRIVEMITDCLKYGFHHWRGKNVDGTVWGNPSLTGDQWRALQHVKHCESKIQKSVKLKKTKKRKLAKAGHNG